MIFMRETGLRLGIDLGGTKCAVVAADEQYRILHKTVYPTGRAGMPEMILDKVLRCCREYLYQERETGRLLSVGVSCGGPLNERTGHILSPPNLPLWKDVGVTELLTETFGVQAFLKNDANACALAEWKMGAGRGTKNMIFLTFGTGMGAGLILNGRLYSGTTGTAGEVGHIRLSESGPEGYGKRGSFEGYCSGGGLSRLAKELTGEHLSAKEICRMADAGDERAIGILQASAKRLGQGLAMLADMLNPEMIVIGSIYQRAGKHFEEEMQRVFREEALAENVSACRIVPAGLGESIGDIACLMAGEGI